jgi:hypothetical protein
MPQLPQDAVFEARGVRAILPAGMYLQPRDQFVLTMIKESWGDRPIFFAATTNLHRELGLDSYVARQGVAFKLVDPSETQRLVPMPRDQPYSPVFGAYMDVERTRQLLWNVFTHRDLINQPHWADDSTRGIPTYYGYAHFTLAEAENRLGNAAAAQRNAAQGERWMGLAER